MCLVNINILHTYVYNYLICITQYFKCSLYEYIVTHWFLSQLRVPASLIVGSSEDKLVTVSTPSSVVSDTTINFIGRMIFLHATL